MKFDVFFKESVYKQTMNKKNQKLLLKIMKKTEFLKYIIT